MNAGPAFIGAGAQTLKPQFAYSPRTVDRSRLWSAGAAYRLQESGTGELSVGILRDYYNKIVVPPGQPLSNLSEAPWRLYGNAEAAIGRVIGYAGYTQGLEDSGTAPNSAANANAPLPASETWQADAGVRYPLGSRLTVITGLFEIHKPYFNVDADNVDRQLGAQRAVGLELSIAGRIATGLSLNAGAVLASVEVTGPNLATEGIGSAAVGQARNQFRISFDYRVPRWEFLSLDLELYHFGRAPAIVSDGLYASAITTLKVGARYRFTLMGAPAVLRIQAQNLTNCNPWNVSYSPGFYPFESRAFLAYLMVALGQTD